MRKRNFSHCVDTVFWWVIYSLPIVIFLLYLISFCVSCGGLSQAGIIADLQGGFSETQAGQSGTITAFQEWWSDPWIDAFHDGWIKLCDNTESFTGMWLSSCMESDLGIALRDFYEYYVTNGYGNDAFTLYILASLTWFIYANIIHLAVDFLLFIPRLAHKWLKKGTQDD